MAWTFIQRLSTPTSNAFTFTGLSLGSYQRIALLLDGLVVGTDDADILLQLSTAGTLRTSGYRYFLSIGVTSSTTTTINSAAAANIPLVGTGANFGVGNAANESYSGRCEISNLGATLYKHVEHNSVWVGPTASGLRGRGLGILEQSGAIDGLVVSVNTGTLTAGSAEIIGLATS